MIRLVIISLLWASVAHGANLLENSSFEADDLRGWSYGAYSDSKRSAIPLAFTNRYTYHGGKAMTMETGAETYHYVVSRLYRLVPNTQYTLSVYVKSEYAVSSSFARPYMEVVNSVVGDSASTNPLPTDTNWNRITLTFTTTNVAQCTYVIRFTTSGNNNPAGSYCHFDAVQLETGASATAYAPMSGIEIGPNLDRTTPAHIFYAGTNPVLPFVAFNNGTAGGSATMKWRVYDWWNDLRVAGSEVFTIGASNSVTNAISIALTGKTNGLYSLQGWIDGTNGSQCEVTFAVISAPIAVSHRTNGMFGSETYCSPWFLSAFQRMGIHWNRNLTVDTWSHWGVIAPTSLGSPVLTHTNRVALMRTYDIEPLVHLGAGQLINGANLPEYARDAALIDTYHVDGTWPSNALGSNYCKLVVTNYAPWVDYFELLNEQVYMGESSTYHPLWTNIINWWPPAIRAVSSTAMIVAPADFFYGAVSNMVWDVGRSNWFDFWSTHMYPNPTSELDTRMTSVAMAKFNKTGWNTETGGRNDTAKRQALLEESLFTPSITPAGGYNRHRNYRTAINLHNLWQTLSGQVRKYFYYEGRNTGGHDGYIAFSLFDFDNTIGAMGVAYACHANLMENGTSLGTNFFHTNLVAYIYSRSNQVLIGLFPTLDVVSTMAPTPRLAISTSADAQILDVLGNPHPAGTVLFGREPVIVRGAAGVTSNTLATSLTIYRTNDIEAPHLAITTYPTDTNYTRFTWRWSAPDDTCLESRDVVTNNAVQFRYKITGDPDWSIWTNQCFVTRTGLVAGVSPTFYIESRDVEGNTALAQWPEAQAFLNSTMSGTATPSGNVRLQ